VGIADLQEDFARLDRAAPSVGGEAGHLLFSDVPGNAIYSWDGKRTTVFLAPSGYQGFPIPTSLREAGSNGLALGR
jgi:sugar lactone lactonase YvrE